MILEGLFSHSGHFESEELLLDLRLGKAPIRESRLV